MGEHRKEENFVLSAESFDKAEPSFKALAILDGFIQSCKHVPYFPRAEQIISKMRIFAQKQLEAEAEYEAHQTMFDLKTDGFDVMSFSKCSEKMRDAHLNLVSLLVELQPLLDEMEKSVPIEQEPVIKPEDNILSFPITCPPPIQQRWLDNLDDILALKRDCPYSVQTKDLSKEVREVVEEMIQCELAQFGLSQKPLYSGSLEGMEASQELEEKKHKTMLRLLAKYVSLEVFAQKVLNWKSENAVTRKTKFALKYMNNTFTYCKTSRELPANISFANLCDVFYSSCPKSGKMPWEEVVDLLRKRGEKRNMEKEQVRQWIKGFNIWIRGRRLGFGDRLSGNVLKLSGADIVKLK